jgi:hypothetical protein
MVRIAVLQLYDIMIYPVKPDTNVKWDCNVDVNLDALGTVINKVCVGMFLIFVSVIFLGSYHKYISVLIKRKW